MSSLADKLYAGTRRVYGMDAQVDRQVHVTKMVDLLLDTMNDIPEDDREAARSVLDGLDAAKVHPDVLDAALAVIEEREIRTLSFEKDARDAIALVDEAIPKMKLLDTEGRILSMDVRGDAKKLYREQAKKFKKDLKEDGDLDRHYASRRADPEGTKRRSEELQDEIIKKMFS